MCLTAVTCLCSLFFFLMIRRPPRSTLDRSSAASDVYKRQVVDRARRQIGLFLGILLAVSAVVIALIIYTMTMEKLKPVSYTHLRAHETVLDLVCRLLLEKKKNVVYLRLYYSFIIYI